MACLARGPSQRLAAVPPGFLQVSTVTLHITAFEGGSALSEFRVQQLLPRLQTVHPKLTGLAARFVHLVATDHPLEPAEQERLAALLTYGEPWRAAAVAGSMIVV